MGFVFLFFGIFSYLVGIALLSVAKFSTHENIALIIILNGTVLIVGSSLLSAIKRLNSNILDNAKNDSSEDYESLNNVNDEISDRFVDLYLSEDRLSGYYSLRRTYDSLCKGDYVNTQLLLKDIENISVVLNEISVLDNKWNFFKNNSQAVISIISDVTESQPDKVVNVELKLRGFYESCGGEYFSSLTKEKLIELI